MLWLNKQKFVKLGQTLAPADFIKLVKKKYNSSREVSYYQLNDLMKGARKAFRAGQVENVQEVMKDALNIRGYSLFDQVLKESEDKVADIARMTATMTAEKKQELLKNKLENAFTEGDVERRDVLLAAGAVIPVKDPEFFARVLVSSGATLETITYLQQAGCSFKETMALMVRNSWSAESMEKLKFFRQEIEGVPADGAAPITQEALAKLLQTQAEMAEQIRDLTAIVKQQQGTAAPAVAPEAKPATPAPRPFSSKPYPHA